MVIRSLRAQLIAGLITISVIFTLLSSAIQVYWDYRDALGEVDSQFNLIEQHSRPYVALLMANSPFEMLQPALQTIANMPAAHRVDLYIDGKLAVSAGAIDLQQAYRLRDIPLANTEKSAHLTVYASLTPIKLQLYRRAVMIVLTNGLRTLIVALFIALFFDRIAIRPMRKVTGYLKSNAPGQPHPKLEFIDSHFPRSDELNELVAAVNQMQVSLGQYESTLKAEKDRYFALVDNNPEAIWRCQLDLPLDCNWDRQRQLAHLQQYAKIAEGNHATLKFCQGAVPYAQDDWRPSFITDDLWHNLISHHGQTKDLLISGQTDDKQVYYLSVSAAAVTADNQCQTIWGISINITARILAQQALELRGQQLKASQQRLAEAQVLANMGHWDYHTYGDDLFVSEEFARIYGFAAQDPAPSWPMLIERIHPEDRHYVIDALSNPSSEGIGAEHRIVWPNGEIRHVQAVARKRIEDGRVAATFGIILDITERRRAEDARSRSQQALIESEARMAEAQALAHMGHWVLDYQTKTFTCSDEFYRIYGHQPGDLPAKLKHFNRQIHPDDQERISASLSVVRERAITENYRIIRADGALRYIRGSATPFYSAGKNIDRVFGISIDVTEQTIAERALQASQELVNSAFQASPDGIAFVQTNPQDTVIVTSNPTFQQITGFDNIQLQGQSVDILRAECPQQNNGANQLETLLLNHHEVKDWEITLRHQQGQLLHCLISWQSVKLQNQTQKLVFLRDVTQLRKLEKINQQQTRQLLHADKLASLGTMVAGVAHEINNPNHIIQMNTDLLAEFSHQILELLDDLPQDQLEASQFSGLSLDELNHTMPELFEDMKSCCRRIDRIVKDLKDFARPRENAEYLPLDLNLVIDQCQTLLTPALENKKVRLNLQQSPVPLIFGDSQQLQQVIVNLTVNAIDSFFPPASGVVTIRTFYKNSTDQVVCEIEDQGCGIAAEHLNQIFDPFFTTKQEQGGTGLGLAISFQLVREHGGLMEVCSSLGQGTTLKISFPQYHQRDPKDECTGSNK